MKDNIDKKTVELFKKIAEKEMWHVPGNIEEIIVKTLKRAILHSVTQKSEFLVVVAYGGSTILSILAPKLGWFDDAIVLVRVANDKKFKLGVVPK